MSLSPTTRRVGLLMGLAIVMIALAQVPWLPAYYVRVIDSILIYVVLAVGLNIVVGYAGLLDLGFIAFYAVGAYAYGLLASTQFGIHLPFPLIFLIGAGVGAVAGLALGFPVLKLRGDYLAIVTLSFGEIIRILINNLDGVTNGPQGIAALDRASLFGLPMTSPVHFYGLLLGVAMLVCVGVHWLEASILGKAWRALREDQDVVRGLGINTTLLKLSAFAISAAIGGASGVIFGAFQRFVSPESFTFQESLMVVLIIIIGGVGNILGIIAGAILLVVLPEVLHPVAEYRMLIFGLILVLVILLRPQGLVPSTVNLSRVIGKIRASWFSSSNT